MAEDFAIRAAGPEPGLAEALAVVLADCVAGGASVGYMDGLDPDRAVAFWTGALAAAGRGERILLVAEDGASGAVVGTVQVLLAMPDNQPHRAEVAKMLVSRAARRRGVGEALMRAAEDAARRAGRTLLVLDTVSGSPAARLYERLGWIRVGDVPGYALWPDGRPCSTTFYYRNLESGAPSGHPHGWYRISID
jgi:ribosomal protein S18 acetylase RimI-like enzyme